MAELKLEIPKRSYSGNKWVTNPTNKKYLRKDFKGRCAYCDDWDDINGGARYYHVEHFAPKDKFPLLKFDYGNLLYACPYCNGSKSDKWPSNDANVNIVGNEGFIDPCDEEYYKHLHRNEDGSIGYDTDLGKYMYEELNLGLKRHKILYRMGELHIQLSELERVIYEKKEKGDDVTELESLMGKLSTEYWKKETIIFE